VLALLVGLGIAANFAWTKYAPTIALHPQYDISADDVTITPPPPWIRSDIKSEVLRDAGLIGNVSVLDDWNMLAERLRDAFEMHPWVDSVVRIERRLPSAIDVQLTYRQPIAAVESIEAGGMSFLPIDEHAIRLPDVDLTETERRYLPRISGVTGRPLVGDAWEDPRVVGGAQLAALLADIWQRLRLVEISSPPQPLIRNDVRIYTYEIITTGGTRILWGATNGQETVAGEPPFAEKRQRLLDYAAQHGKLESIDGPESIDLRGDLVVTPHTARNKNVKSKAGATQTK
jgi:hypothetical protein